MGQAKDPSCRHFLPDVEAEFERQRERVRQFIDDLETASKRP